MSDPVLLPPDSPEIPDRPYRPSPPRRGPGQLLRQVVGVKEDILDWVPEERPRYSRLGAVVVNTGVLAGLSLFVALRSVVDGPWPELIPAALFWGLLIFGFDSWMIASTHGAMNAARLRIFIPRVAISVLIGAVIAEPLVLWIFRPAIHKEVLDERRAELDGYEGLLKRCNPPAGPVQSGECTGYLVNASESPQAVQEQLDTTRRQRDQLQADVSGIERHLDQLEALARAECAGNSGPGLTGIPGDGPECRRNREIADRYLRDSALAEKQVALAARNREVAALTVKLGTARQTYGRQVAAEIAAKVKRKRAEQGQIGILDEDRALEALSSRSTFILVAQWLVRLLLIAVDCLPVLVKVLGGTTSYDLLVWRQLEVAKRLHDKHLGVREQRDAGVADIRLRHLDYDRQYRLAQIEEADRAGRARHEHDLDAEIEELAERAPSERPNRGNTPEPANRAAPASPLAGAAPPCRLSRNGNA
jgi:hypothetical protein